jgi:integrase
MRAAPGVGDSAIPASCLGAASTQNQALAALLFLYEHVLHGPAIRVERVIRAKGPLRLPVVLSRDEGAAVLSHLDGAMWIIGVLLYGAGLRLEECLDLRVKDADFDRHQIIVRRGKGQPVAANEPRAVGAVLDACVGGQRAVRHRALASNTGAGRRYASVDRLPMRRLRHLTRDSGSTALATTSLAAS